MVRRMVAFSALLTLLSCGGGDPFDPGLGDDSRFYPLSVGNTWEYTRYGTYTIDTLSYTVSGTALVRILGTATHAGDFQVYLEETTVNDTVFGLTILETVDTCFIRVTSDGFFGYPHLTTTDSSWTVPFPLFTGKVWTFSTEPPMTGEILSMSETVLVPGGTFEDCMEMRTLWIEGGNVVNTADYAPNVGMVRNLYSMGAAGYTVEIMTRLSSWDLMP